VAPASSATSSSESIAITNSTLRRCGPFDCNVFTSATSPSESSESTSIWNFRTGAGTAVFSSGCKDSGTTAACTASVVASLAAGKP